MTLLRGHRGVRVADGVAFDREVDDQASLACDPSAQVIEGAVGKNPTLASHHDPRAECLDVVHIVRREDDGHAFIPVELLDEITDGQLGDGVEADGRFVEEEDGWTMEKGSR